MSRWNEFDRTLDMVDELRRRMDRMFYDRDADRGRGGLRALYEDVDRTGSRDGNAWPRVNLFDTGSSLIVKADAPGLTEKDMRLTIHQEVLTLSGERKPDAPEGYSAHRQERTLFRFSRSFALPYKVDTEKTTATLRDGVLTITLAKAPEAQPRQIQVQAG